MNCFFLLLLAPTIHPVQGVAERVRACIFMGVNGLKKLYFGLVHSVIEYSSFTNGPMHSKQQEISLENIQKVPQFHVWLSEEICGTTGRVGSRNIEDQT